MVLDLSSLVNNNLSEMPIDCEIDVPKEYLDNTDIRDISSIKVSGYIDYNGEDYNLNIDVSGTMILGCARTLKDVSYPFSINIDETVGENSEKTLQIVQNRLDIFPIIWQYILVDVPLRVLAPDADDEVIEGEGWRLITEDEEKEEIDPRLAKLSDFIKE